MQMVMVAHESREHSKQIYKTEWFVELLLDLCSPVNCKRQANADGTYLSSAPLSAIS